MQSRTAAEVSTTRGGDPLIVNVCSTSYRRFPSCLTQPVNADSETAGASDGMREVVILVHQVKPSTDKH